MSQLLSAFKGLPKNERTLEKAREYSKLYDKKLNYMTEEALKNDALIEKNRDNFFHIFRHEMLHNIFHLYCDWFYNTHTTERKKNLIDIFILFGIKKKIIDLMK